MLRRWLAVLRALDAEEEAEAARLRDTGSPPSEEPTANVTEAGEKTNAQDEKNPSREDAASEPAAEPAAEPGTEPTASFPETPRDPDAEWADVQMPAVPAAVVANGEPERVSIDVVVDASAGDGARAVPRFWSKRSDERFDARADDADDADDDALTFRDVLLRSRCLENLAASFTRAPPGDDAEAVAFADFADALVWPAGDPTEASETAGLGSSGARARWTPTIPPEHASRGASPSPVAALLVSCVARAGAALRDPKRTAEVQLGDDALAEMLATGAGSVKRVGVAETLRRRETRFRAASDATAATVRALRGGDSISGHASPTFDASAADDSTRRRHSADASATRSSRDANAPTTETPPETPPSPEDAGASAGVHRATLTSALASATRAGVDLCRRAHDHAAARARRLAAECERAPTEDALMRCRASLETLAHASTDVAGLSEQSRARLLEAERFWEEKLRACVEAEAARRAEAREAERVRAEAAARLADLTLDAARRAEAAERAATERAAFEARAEAVRETLERKVRDLRDRAEEYGAERRAIAAVRDSLRELARARASALEAAAGAASADLASARRRYVEAARAHGEGQVDAARLCLARLRFCKKALEETRRKRAEASALGVRGGDARLGASGEVASSAAVPSASREDGEEATAFATEGGGSVSADLRASQRSIERAYVEAEEGAKAVFAAAEASRREAAAIAPAAAASAARGGGNGTIENPRSGDPPFYLTAVFDALDETRAAFAAEAATRPALEMDRTRTIADETVSASPTSDPARAADDEARTSLSETVAPPVEPRGADSEPSSLAVAFPAEDAPAGDSPNAAEAANDDVDDWLAET